MVTRRPEPGDRVCTTTRTPITPIDRLTGTGLPSGTTGVVRARSGGRVSVEFETRHGPVSRTMAASAVTVSRRADQRPGLRWARIRPVIRVAFVLYLLWPVAAFVASYLWQERSTDGIVSALILAMIESMIDFVAAAPAQPVKTVLYLAVFALMSRIAFGR